MDTNPVYNLGGFRTGNDAFLKIGNCPLADESFAA
jgi:hypothetical protein